MTLPLGLLHQVVHQPSHRTMTDTPSELSGGKYIKVNDAVTELNLWMHRVVVLIVVVQLFLMAITPVKHYLQGQSNTIDVNVTRTHIPHTQISVDDATLTNAMDVIVRYNKQYNWCRTKVMVSYYLHVYPQGARWNDTNSTLVNWDCR